MEVVRLHPGRQAADASERLARDADRVHGGREAERLRAPLAMVDPLIYQRMIEQVEDYAIYMLDREGIIASWNLGAQRIHGYEREDIVGQHFSHLFTPEDIAAGKPWEELGQARRSGRAQGEGWRVKNTGERFWARA